MVSARFEEGVLARGGPFSGPFACESGPLRAVHLSRHKWPGKLGLGEGIYCPLSMLRRDALRVEREVGNTRE